MLHWAGALLPPGESRVHHLVQRLSAVDFHTMMFVYSFLLLSTAWLAFARGRWATLAAVLLLSGFSLLWFGVNHRWEGRILYTVSTAHGVTQADLVVPALILSALVVRGLRIAMARPSDGKRESP